MSVRGKSKHYYILKHMNDLVIHACEQVLRFTAVSDWSDLSEERKVQLSFNLGLCTLGLGLTKEEGYDALASTRRGELTIQELHAHLRAIVQSQAVVIDEEKVAKPF